MGRRDRSRTPETQVTTQTKAAVRSLARRLRGPEDLDPMLERIGEARFVLLGEASHGTSEFYTWRAALSKRLILERGFTFLAVEGDWPDCYQVNRYLEGHADSGGSARDVLYAFERWPTWMWANEEIATLISWLRRHNDGRPPHQKVGFYGLDVYSLWDSLDQVMNYLRKSDGSALAAARRAFRCFEPYGEDEQEYARATRWVPDTCEEEVVELLRQVRARAPVHATDGDDAHFTAEQNALVLRNAEAYYRAMVRSGPESWNLRDRHMAETLERLADHHGPGSKAIVWAHNTHIGDARFTDMVEDDMINLGQLVRERHGESAVVLVGFGSHRGSVVAGREWGEPWERMRVPPGRPGSWEDVLHEAVGIDSLLLFTGSADEEPLRRRRGHRAIGVVYRPQWEHLGNYVPTVLSRRYDAFVYLDQTEALRPLHLHAHEEGEVPETYPSGV